jgi:hypothetical protein
MNQISEYFKYKLNTHFMKKSVFTRLMILLMVPVFFYACNKDEDTKPIVLIPKLSGLYVFGTNTVAEVAVDPNAKMARALLNPGKSGGDENRDGIYGKWMYIGANSTIQFTYVDTSLVPVSYGSKNGGSFVAGADLGATDIKDSIISDTLVINEVPIKITEEGLYYVFVNFNSLEYRIMKVRAEMIGDATDIRPLWSAGVSLPQVFASKDSAIFEGTDLTLTGASGYKYMFSNGWELFNNGNMATYTSLGVESYADAWASGINDIGYFNENIPHKEDGRFTIRLKYTASTGEWKEAKIKTGKILIDYTSRQIALFGSAWLMAPGDTANWRTGDGYGLKLAEKVGYVYTWTWNAVPLLQGREFIFLENGAWGGIQLDWSMLTSVGGQAVTDNNIVDATTTGGEWHNFQVSVGGTYNLTLVIDAEAETKTVTILKVP